MLIRRGEFRRRTDAPRGCTVRNDMGAGEPKKCRKTFVKQRTAE